MLGGVGWQSAGERKIGGLLKHRIIKGDLCVGGIAFTWFSCGPNIGRLLTLQISQGEMLVGGSAFAGC